MTASWPARGAQNWDVELEANVADLQSQVDLKASSSELAASEAAAKTYDRLGVHSVKDYGAVADNGATNDGAAFADLYADASAGIVLNTTIHPSNRSGTVVMEIPAGTYLVEDPESFMTDLGQARALGLTIRGAGRGITNIIFSPSTSDEYLLFNNDDWLHVTFEDISFISTDSTASFMKSYSTGGAQNYVFNRVNWRGTWKYGLDLVGTNNNSEFSFFHCGIYGEWSAFQYVGASGTSDQFVNYNYYACQAEITGGNFIDMAKGGGINVWGGSIILGETAGSGVQIGFALRGATHGRGVQKLLVEGARVELRNADTQLIYSEWGGTGSIKFSDVDTSSQASQGHATSVVAAEFNYGSAAGPIIVWDGCQLMGKHAYNYESTSYAYQRRVVYRNCEINNYDAAADFITMASVGGTGNAGSKIPVEFDECRGASGITATGYKHPFDCVLNWEVVAGCQPKHRVASIKIPSGTLPYNSDASRELILPLNATITRVRLWKGVSGAATNTDWTYTLTDGDAVSIASAAGGGSAQWKDGFDTDTGAIFLRCTTTNKRTLTLTAVNASAVQAESFCLVEYIA